ncbi:[acyl-carrier-protein] S-malonyltransferase [Verrucomicrobia bacterium LW23]|nr:[acyl-carrier-protein] S-malonyltransferase [Verrucomicrobia bacterium LW23]
MTRIYMFPGQGSQKVGMGGGGSDTAGGSATPGLFARFADLTAQADAELGYSIQELCLTDPEGKLNNTAYTQPALYVVSALTHLAKLQDSEAAPDFVIGHSLGEYNALFAAGVFDFLTGLKLVKRRGALMSEATGGGMAAVLGLSPEAIANALSANGLDAIDIANLNAPTQTVISGPADAIAAAKEPLEKAGAAKVVILNVSGAFHSRYMKSAADQFELYLREFTFAAPKIPVISNVTATAYAGTAEDTIDNLKRQIYSSVRWVETIDSLLTKPEPTFEEVGPGNVLAGLHRQITRAKKR